MNFRNHPIRFFLFYGCISLFVSAEASANLREIPKNLLIQARRTSAMATTLLSSAFDYPAQAAQGPRILRYGNPKLYEESEPFKLPDEMPLVHEVLEQMKLATEGMGNVGLAAPQIGILKRLVMFAIPATHPRYKTDGVERPMRIMINPRYMPLNDEKNLGWEGCLSVPGMMGQVWRYTHIECKYIDLEGKEQTFKASDFHARVVQHEIDHLKGVLFPLLVEDGHSLGFTEEIMQTPEFRKSRGLE